jgi:hypothetical protein
MHDLRLKVLRESGKTMSRKARSRPESLLGSAKQSPRSSPGHSRGGSPTRSPAPSQPGSRFASEDEGGSDDDFDESMTASTNSNKSEDFSEAGWEDRLRDQMAELLDRKRSSVKGREVALAAYLHLVRYHYAAAEIGSSQEILDALLKSVKSGSSTEETVLALKAIAVTVFTCQSDNVYERIGGLLQDVCLNAEDEEIKIAAIQTLTIAALVGGGSDNEFEELLEFLLAIVESDGESINAGDNGSVVTAALESWGFVATALDIEHLAADAMNAFIEQLESTNVDVQISASNNIALVFEASRRKKETEEEEYELGEREDEGKGFNLQHDPKDLGRRISQILKHPTKSMSKKDHSKLRSGLISVVTSLEREVGPGYSTALKQKSKSKASGMSRGDYRGTGEFGYRQKITIGKTFKLIDSWTLSVRLVILKAVLQGGFNQHFNENPLAKDLLGSMTYDIMRGGDVAKWGKTVHDIGGEEDEDE